MTPDDRALTRLPIAELGGRLAAGELSAEALVAECLERIAALNPSLNAFVTVLDRQAREQARRADCEIRSGAIRGPLHGIPISVKDVIDVEGVPTTAASLVRTGHIAKADAPAVARLRRAGAIIVGKCNLHEFAFGTTSDESAFGPVRNPADLRRSAGGSSGGSAAAVAAGLSCLSIGTDTGGSIRIPAAACGVVGLKPSLGEIPSEGIVPLARSLDHVGPLARRVTDAWLAYEAMRGRTPAIPAVVAAAGLRLGVPRSYFLDLLDLEVAARFNEALARLRRAGAAVAEVDVPHGRDAASIYLHVSLPEAAAYHARTLDRAPDQYSPGVRLRLELGRYVLAEDYVRAQRGRLVLAAEIDDALRGRDALILPTLPIPAPPIGASTVSIDGIEHPIRAVMLRLTQLFDLTGHPAISLPAGTTDSGLPCGVQLVGRCGDTPALLRAAFACEPPIAGGGA
jgi:aspartyl-tRNA(Asn)/glutamyl-tRNA(Gln) amidotransferase subunit A